MVNGATFAFDTQPRRRLEEILVAFACKEIFADGKQACASATHAVVPCVRLWMADRGDGHWELPVLAAGSLPSTLKPSAVVTTENG